METSMLKSVFFVCIIIFAGCTEAPLILEKKFSATSDSQFFFEDGYATDDRKSVLRGWDPDTFEQKSEIKLNCSTCCAVKTPDGRIFISVFEACDSGKYPGVIYILDKNGFPTTNMKCLGAAFYTFLSGDKYIFIPGGRAIESRGLGGFGIEIYDTAENRWVYNNYDFPPHPFTYNYLGYDEDTAYFSQFYTNYYIKLNMKTGEWDFDRTFTGSRYAILRHAAVGQKYFIDMAYGSDIYVYDKKNGKPIARVPLTKPMFGYKPAFIDPAAFFDNYLVFTVQDENSRNVFFNYLNLSSFHIDYSINTGSNIDETRMLRYKNRVYYALDNTFRCWDLAKREFIH
jgi:hypothetical protein